MGEISYLFMALLGTNKIKRQTPKSAPHSQILKKFEYTSGNNNGFKAFKLVNKQAEREKN